MASTRPDGDPSPAALKQRLGAHAIGASRDIRAVAELAAGEQVAACVIALWQRRGWVVVATDAGLRLARRPLVFGRRRQESFGWHELVAVDTGPQRVAMTFGSTEVDLMAVGPHAEFVRLIDLARDHLGGDKPAVEGLRAMARQRLGRLVAFTFEAAIDSLPDRLEAGERVERLAGASLDFDGLLVLTDRRLLLFSPAIRRSRERLWAIDRHDIRSVEPVDEGLRLVLAEGAATLTAFQPPDRRDELAVVLGAMRA